MRRFGLAVAVAICLAAFAAQGALAYTDEGAMIATTNYTDRSAFIIDQLPVVNNPPGFIPQSVFLSQPYLSYYEQYGFDRNFFTWNDPNGSFVPNKQGSQWSGYRERRRSKGAPTHQTTQPDGRLLCQPTSRSWTPQDSRSGSLVATGPVHGFVWSRQRRHDPLRLRPSAGTSRIRGPANAADDHRNQVRRPEPTTARVTLRRWQPRAGPRRVRLLTSSSRTCPCSTSHGDQVTATSAADGNYTFQPGSTPTLYRRRAPIGPGEYEIKEEPQAGWTMSTPQPIMVQRPGGQRGARRPGARYRQLQAHVPPSITTAARARDPDRSSSARRCTTPRNCINVTRDRRRHRRLHARIRASATPPRRHEWDARRPETGP